jgi:hypothetical protein
MKSGHQYDYKIINFNEIKNDKLIQFTYLT